MEMITDTIGVFAVRVIEFIGVTLSDEGNGVIMVTGQGFAFTIANSGQGVVTISSGATYTDVTDLGGGKIQVKFQT